MNIWCCALIFAGTEPPVLLPLPTDKPGKVEDAPLAPRNAGCANCTCAECKRKASSRSAVSVQAIPPMTPPSDSKMLTPVAVSSNPAYSQHPQTTPMYTFGASSENATLYPTAGVVAEASHPSTPRTPWWKRAFGRRPAVASEMPFVAESVPARPMPVAAGRIHRRENWREREVGAAAKPAAEIAPAPYYTAAVMPTDVATPLPTPEPTLVEVKELVEAPVQMATTTTKHTVKKVPAYPSKVMRNASALEYSKPREKATKKPEQQAPDAKKSGAPMNWVGHVMELPEAPIQPSRVALASECAGKCDEKSCEQQCPAPNASAEVYAGTVAWSKAAGGCWMLTTDAGGAYMLNGEPSLLRLRDGDEIEVSGAVQPARALGVSMIAVEKLTLTLKR